MMATSSDVGTVTRNALIGYKIFDAARRCRGDVTALAGVLVDGLGDLAPKTALISAAEGVIKLYGRSGADFQSTVRDFEQFTGDFAHELAERDCARAAAVMTEARCTHEAFVRCDTDGNGGISKEEFVSFASEFDMSETEAVSLFEALDANKSGELSFREWLELEDVESVYVRLATAARPAQAGYKIYQAARQCRGDSSVLADALVEGLGEFASEDALVKSAESMIKLYGTGHHSSENMWDFGQFATRLSEEFVKHGNVEAAARMAAAHGIYISFLKCDTTGSGTISEEEFISFVAAMGMDEHEAVLLFSGVDSDRNGAISFQEWIEFTEVPAGRDRRSFDCAGHHALKEYVITAVPLCCDWCERDLPEASTAFGCQICDCHACVECFAFYQSRRDSPPRQASPHNPQLLEVR